MTELTLNRDQYLEVEKIGLGAFAPLSGFMNETEINSVADTLRLPSGDVFTIPVVLDMGPEDAERLRGNSKVSLIFEGVEVADFSPEDIFAPNKLELAEKFLEPPNLNTLGSPI